MYTDVKIGEPQCGPSSWQQQSPSSLQPSHIFIFSLKHCTAVLRPSPLVFQNFQILKYLDIKAASKKQSYSLCHIFVQMYIIRCEASPLSVVRHKQFKRCHDLTRFNQVKFWHSLFTHFLDIYYKRLIVGCCKIYISQFSSTLKPQEVRKSK